MRRCRLRAEQITAEHISIANDQLYLLLSDLANRGLQLWCIEKTIYPLYNGVATIATIDGTVDLLNSNLRYLTEVTGTNTDTATSRTIEFDTDTVVTTVGIKWDGPSVPLDFEQSYDGIVWTNIQSETPSAAAGEWSWIDVAATVAAPYFRVSTTAPALTYLRLYTGNNPTEIPLSRLNRDQYTSLPNKTFPSNRPLQFWLDRKVTTPVLNLWPVPNSAAETSQIVVWAQRHIMDVGTMTQQIEVPQRWLEAITAGLAAKLAMEVAEVDPGIIGLLDSKAAIALDIAQQEEQDDSPFTMMPNISAYTS